MTDDWPTIAKLAKSVQSGEVSAVTLVERALARAEQVQDYHATLELIRDRALMRAKEIDALVADGKPVGRLAGVPFVAKDNFLTLGSKTTAASHMLESFEAPYQSTAIERLEAEGAICVAKANLDAFAHGSSTENSDFGPTQNPHDKTKVPGGSSGGSAAAVVLRIAPFALGTDTGGSIRLPASFCGVVGLKPTYGVVSRYGVIAMASSTDCIGPLTRTVEDAALVLDVMSGKDPRDSTTIERDDLQYANQDTELAGKKFGVIKQYMEAGLANEVRASIEHQISVIKLAGGEIVELDLPAVDLALACYYIIVPAEVSSNLSRYDGIRYGLSESTGGSLDEAYKLTRSRGFNAENKRRIIIGTYVLSSGYYDAYYKKAQTVRTKLINEFNDAFTKIDFMIGPTAATTAFAIGEHAKDPLAMYLTDIMTVAANLVGVPSISLPCPVEGMPIGLQIMAPQRFDRELLAVAKAIEEANA